MVVTTKGVFQPTSPMLIGVDFRNTAAIPINVEIVQAPIGQVHHDAGTRSSRQEMLRGQVNLRSGAWQPRIDARIRRDYLVKSQMVAPGNIRQRVIAFDLCFTRLTHKVLVGCQRHDLATRGRRQARGHYGKQDDSAAHSRNPASFCSMKPSGWEITTNGKNGNRTPSARYTVLTRSTGNTLMA